MYVRTREQGLGQIHSPYIRSSSPFGSYLGDLAQPPALPAQLRNAWSARHNKQEIFDVFRAGFGRDAPSVPGAQCQSSKNVAPRLPWSKYGSGFYRLPL